MKVVYIKNISGSVKVLNAKEFTVGEEYSIPPALQVVWFNDATADAIHADEFQVGDGANYIADHLGQIAYLGSDVPAGVQTTPFSCKDDYNFNGIGVTKTIASGATENVDIEVPTGTFDFEGLSIIACNMMDLVEYMQILDNEAGSYGGGEGSAVLNQFATDWNTAKDKCSEILPYTARVYAGMIIRVRYKNNGASEITIGVNVPLHRLVTA